MATFIILVSSIIFTIWALVSSSLLVYASLKILEKLWEIIYTRTHMYAWLFSLRSKMSDEEKKVIEDLYRKYRNK